MERKELVLEVDRNRCIYCGACVSVCPSSALWLGEVSVKVDDERCTRCRICVRACPAAALELKSAK